MTAAAVRVRDVAARWWPLFALAALVLVVGVAHVWWLDHFRRGLPLDIDEAGYLGFAVDNADGLASGGLRGFHQAVVDQRTFGPLLPLVATPLLRAFGTSTVTGMSAQLVFLPVLAFATYGLGARLAGRGAGVLGAGLVLLSPGVFDFSRTFHLVVPSTACLALAVWALVESDGFRRWVPTAVAGIAVGLLVLSRTYTIVFLPGIALAGVVLVARAPAGARARAALGAGVAGVLAVVAAGWWYIPNREPVFDYLTTYGYGSKSRLYQSTANPPVWSLDFWTQRLSQVVSDGLFLVTFAILLLGVVAYAALRFASRARGKPRAWPDRWQAVLTRAASPAGTILIVLTVSYLVLTSSANRGTGFTIPLVPLVVVLAVTCLVRLPRIPRNALVAMLAVAVVGVAIGKTEVSGALGEPRCISLPMLGCSIVTDGRGVVHRLLEATGYDGTDPAVARAGAPGGWVRVTDRAARSMHASAAGDGTPPVVAFASRDPLFNTNTVGLAWRDRFGSVLPMAQLRPDEGGDTRLNYLRRLVDPAFGLPSLLLTTDRGRYEFPPKVTQPRAEAAARCVGFQVVDHFTLPDGREARVWQRTVPTPAQFDDRALRALLRRCDASGAAQTSVSRSSSRNAAM